MLARSGISWRWRARRRARTSCWPGSHPAARPPGRRAPDQSRAAPGRWCRMRRRIPAGCSATARPPSRVVAAGRRSHRRDTPRTAARRTAARPRTRALPRATHRRPPRQAGAPGDAPDPRRPDRERGRSEEHTSELQSRSDLVCRLLLEKKIQRGTKVFAEEVDVAGDVLGEEFLARPVVETEMDSDLRGASDGSDFADGLAARTELRDVQMNHREIAGGIGATIASAKDRGRGLLGEDFRENALIDGDAKFQGDLKLFGFDAVELEGSDRDGGRMGLRRGRAFGGSGRTFG